VKVELMGDSRRKVNDDSVSAEAWFDGFGVERVVAVSNW
jgi:hypothetical protein